MEHGKWTDNPLVPLHSNFISFLPVTYEMNACCLDIFFLQGRITLQTDFFLPIAKREGSVGSNSTLIGFAILFFCFEGDSKVQVE